jgi:non-ribosomal peptide synthetase component E (peptide arylation enzyme)
MAQLQQVQENFKYAQLKLMTIVLILIQKNIVAYKISKQVEFIDCLSKLGFGKICKKMLNN